MYDWGCILDDSAFMLTTVTSTKYSNFLRVLDTVLFSSNIKVNIALRGHETAAWP